MSSLLRIGHYYIYKFTMTYNKYNNITKSELHKLCMNVSTKLHFWAGSYQKEHKHSLNFNYIHIRTHVKIFYFIEISCFFFKPKTCTNISLNTVIGML